VGLPTTPTEYHAVAQVLIPESEVVSQEPLKGGISAQIILLTLRASSGELRKFTLRCPGDWGDQDYTKKALREFRKFQIAFQSGLLSPKPIACFEDRNFFVLDYLEGSPNLSQSHAEEYVNVATKHLAQVHQIPLKVAEHEWLPRVSLSPEDTDWQPKVREILNAHGHPAEEPTTLCHGDPWPGNMLWHGNQLVGLIDWEEVHVGFALTDLAIARLDLLFAFGWETMKAFTAAYFQHNPINSTWLPYWDLRCSQRIGNAYESWASSFAPLGRPDITAETLRQRQSDFIEYSISKL